MDQNMLRKCKNYKRNWSKNWRIMEQEFKASKHGVTVVAKVVKNCVN
ncbi:hypothetical protein [Mycoplasmopsis agalactiae]|nr:hypothetical protein [Mycoplasmopsis agalactiae]